MIEKKSIKKTLILLISLILLITLAACTGSETTLNQDKEKNEQITKARLAREKAEKSNDSNNVDETKKNLIQLDKKPEFVLTKEIYKEGDGSLKGTVEYDYDGHGNLLSVKYIDSDDSIVGNIEYKYNDRDLVIEREVKKHPEYFANKWIGNSSAWGMVKEVQEFPRYPNGIAKYTYNKDEQLIEYLEKDKETGEKLRIVEKEYYPGGNLKYDYEWRETGYECEMFYDDVYIRHAYEWTKRIEKNNGKIKTSEQKYDNLGNVIKTISITKKDGNIIDQYTINYKYDEKGNEIKSVSSMLIVEQEYDEKGKEIKEIVKDSEGNIDDIYESEYDDKGNMIRTVSKNPDGSIIQNSESIYDQYNNQIKIISRNGEGEIISMSEYIYKKVSEFDARG